MGSKRDAESHDRFKKMIWTSNSGEIRAKAI